jgi:nucleotide-binding universal stress UspA family protein
MQRQPILVAVDASLEAACAAEYAVRLADAARTECRLVHAVRDPWAAALLAELPLHTAEFRQQVFAAARAQIERNLAGRVPAALVQGLILEAGRPADVIARHARATNAQLVVLGGKHHSVLDRWISGSTALNVVRTTTVPVLITAGAPQPARRVLVALDTSGAARPTLEAARHFASMHGAELRALSIIEPLPPLPEGLATADPGPYLNLCRDHIETELRKLVVDARADFVIRTGPTTATIEAEAAAWHADVVVVGSHGKSWSERVILGSITERLLNDLPATLMVVPVATHAPAMAPAIPTPVAAIA